MNWVEFWKAFAIWTGISITLSMLGAPWWLIWAVVAIYIVYLYKEELRNKMGGSSEDIQ